MYDIVDFWIFGNNVSRISSRARFDGIFMQRNSNFRGFVNLALGQHSTEGNKFKLSVTTLAELYCVCKFTLGDKVDGKDKSWKYGIYSLISSKDKTFCIYGSLKNIGMKWLYIASGA